MTIEEKKRAYEKVLRIGNYTLIERPLKYDPWVVCWLFNDEDYTWCQGYYFNSGISAILFMIQKEYPEKLVEVADYIKENQYNE